MLITCSHCLSKNRVYEAGARYNPACDHCTRPLLDGGSVELGEANFDAVVRGTELPIVLELTAAWCVPSRMMAPQLALAARQMKGQVVFARLDTDKNPRLAQRLGLRGLPALLLLRDGQERQRIDGALQAPQIIEWLERDWVV